MLAPPSKNRPVWMTLTIVEPNANESGSTCVLCWLEAFVYGSELIGIGSTLAAAAAGTISKPKAAAIASSRLPAPVPALSPKID